MGRCAEAGEVLALCRSCAANVYMSRAPSALYAERVACLLFGTAAHESGGFRHRRQIGLADKAYVGGYGLFQLEGVSVEDSLARLDGRGGHRSRPELADVCARWLWQWPVGRRVLRLFDVHQVLELCLGWDRLAVLFARLHYLWVPEAVPGSVEQQAAYWDRHYNRNAEKGTVAEYLRHWVTDCRRTWIGAHKSSTMEAG
jgi:hypothetical protein